MLKLTIIDQAGIERDIDASSGESVMEAAVRNGVLGIDADCGGACACATCHVYIDDAFLERVGPTNEMEQSMLEFAENVRFNSRLSCQIILSEEHEGLRLTTPESQR